MKSVYTRLYTVYRLYENEQTLMIVRLNDDTTASLLNLISTYSAPFCLFDAYNFLIVYVHYIFSFCLTFVFSSILFHLTSKCFIF